MSLFGGSVTGCQATDNIWEHNFWEHNSLRGCGFAFLSALLSWVFLTGCAGVASSSTTPAGGKGLLSTSSSTVPFGNVNAGNASTQTIMLGNTGNATLTVAQVIVSGPGFTISGATLPVTLTIGQSSPVTAKFAPTVAGAASGTISFVSNGSNSPTVVALTGTGTGSTSSPQLSVSPTSANFAVNIGSSQSQPVTVTNAGTTTLSIIQANVSGSGFSVSGLALPLNLPPSQSSSFNVNFAPTVAGSVSGSVSFVTNPTSAATQIALTGNGVQPPSGGVTGVTISPTSPSVQAGQTIQFTAAVQGTATDKSVKWTASAGSIDASGLFTAPSSAGTATVTATSNADASKQASTTVTVTAPPAPGGPMAAFPGAQGGGALSVGGRGGVVYEVTNLNDSGSGSLRACVEASGPRTCVFRTGGTIVLSSTLHVLNPFLTIAGQTAPGAGIQITNSASCNVSNNCDLLRVGTHDVIVRYLRARLSPASGTNYSSPMSILNEPVSVHNVIFDHCSNAWGEWDNWDIYSDSSNIIYDTTLQWSILAEPVYTTNGSVNAVISGSTSATSNGFHDVDMHHNFLTGANHRNPSDRISQSRIVNNLIYNTSYYDIKVMGASDVINNYIKAGPYGGSRTEIQTTTAVSIGTTVTPSLYIVGNAANSNSFNGAADQWTGTLTGLAPGEDNSDTVSTPLSTTYQRTTPLAVVGAAITADPAANLASSTGVLLPVYPNSSGNPGVGASIKLNDSACDGTFLANRDTQDAAYVTQFNNNTGHSGNITGPGTLPTLAAGTPCTSSLHDGIADQWKINYGLSLTDTGLSARTAPNGYTYLENYLNGTNPNLTASTSSTSSLWAASRSPKTMAGSLAAGLTFVSRRYQRREIPHSSEVDFQWSVADASSISYSATSFPDSLDRVDLKSGASLSSNRNELLLNWLSRPERWILVTFSDVPRFPAFKLTGNSLPRRTVGPFPSVSR